MGSVKDKEVGFIVHTVEHREYFVKNTKTLEEAVQVVKDVNLSPKSKRVELIQFGDFEIIEEE